MPDLDVDNRIPNYTGALVSGALEKVAPKERDHEMYLLSFNCDDRLHTYAKSITSSPKLNLHRIYIEKEKEEEEEQP